MINYKKNYILEEAENVIEERRIKAESLVLHYEEILNNNSEYINACNQRAKIVIQIAERNFKNEDIGTLYDELKQSEDNIIEIEKRNGITSDMLTPNFACPLCKDKGYIGGEKCICLKRVYNKLLIKESNINFDDFPFINEINKDFYTGNNTKKAIEKLEQLVGKFDDTKLNNFIIVGKCGGGKTYVMKSFAKSLSEEDKTVLYLTAFGLNNLFLEMTLGDYETKKRVLNQLLDVDLLIVDDIGTEQVYKNVTIENLYSIIDERMTRNKRIMISTNLTPQEILERYDIRIYSRLFHKEKSLSMVFDGDDIRQREK